MGVDADAQAVQHAFAQRTRRHAGSGDAAGEMSAAPGVLIALVLGIGRVVGVTGAQQVCSFGIVAAAGVLVADDHRHGGAGGAALVHAGEELHNVGLGAGGGKPIAPGAAAVHCGGDGGLVHGQACGQTVQHRADGRAVALSENGHRNSIAKGVFHRYSSMPSRAGSSVMGSLSARQQPRPGHLMTVMLLPLAFLSCCM